MKNVVLVILLAAAVAFGGLFVNQRHKTLSTETQLISLRQDLDELQARLDEQEKKASTLQTRLQATRTKAVEKAEEVSTLQQALTNNVEAQAKSKTGNPFSEVMKSPEMKDFVKTQQKVVLGSMMEKNYSAFMTDLQLTPEQSATFKDYLMKKAMVDADAGMSLISGDADATKRAELMKQAKAEKEGVDTEIKQFLGEDNFSKFQTYEKTIPERMSMSMYKDQQGTGPGALSTEQEAQLIQVMTEERQSFKFTTDYADQSKLPDDFSTYFTEEKLNTFQQEMEQLQQKYVNRAQSILTPDQIGPYTNFLKGQLQMQKAGMQMAAKMFGGKGN